MGLPVNYIICSFSSRLQPLVSGQLALIKLYYAVQKLYRLELINNHHLQLTTCLSHHLTIRPSIQVAFDLAHTI